MRRVTLAPRGLVGLVLLVAVAVALVAVFTGGETAPAEATYAVAWNGAAESPVPLRISKYPFNRQWPGKQRDVSQTRLAYAVNVDLADGKGVLALTFADDAAAQTAAETLRFRPSTAARTCGRNGATLTLDSDGPEQYVLEFPGFAAPLHVFVNKPFEDVSGPRVRRFGPGVHEAGLIRVKSGETVVFEKGAHVYGALFLDRANGAKITGRGVLDSSKFGRTASDDDVLNHLYGPVRAGRSEGVLNGTSFCALASTNVTVEGVMFADSPFWTMIIDRDCCGVTVENVKIVGQWRYNSDGIDVWHAKDVVVRDSFIRSFDDCVVARGGAENLLVENCGLWCDWGKNCEVWSMGTGDRITDIVFRGCTLLQGDYMYLDVTAWGPGLDDVLLKNIVFENLQVDFAAPFPKGVPQKRDYDVYPREEKTEHRLAQINFWDFNASEKELARLKTAEHRIVFENLVFRNISFTGDVPTNIVFVVNDNPGPLVIKNLVRENLPPGVILREGVEANAPFRDIRP